MLRRSSCPVQLQEARAAHTSLWLLTSAGVVRAAGCSWAQGNNLLLGLHRRAAPDVWCKVGWSLMTVHVVPPAFHLPLPPTFLFHVATFPPQCQTSGDPVHQPSFETALGAALSPGKKQPQAAANTTLTDTLLSISRVCLWLSCLEQPVQQPHECKLVFEGLVMRHVGSVKYLVTILNTECFPNAHKANCL